jgi:hypothetical protein
MSGNGMSILESMVLSPETLRKRERIMAIAPDLLAGGDPSEPDSTVPDIVFEETGDEIVMIDAPENEPSEPAPAPTNDRSAPDSPAPRPADTGAAAPAPKAETTSSAIETVVASVAAPVTSTPDAAPRTPERKAEEARELNAPLETRAAATNLIQLVMNNATAGVIGNVRPMGGAERIATAEREKENKKDEEFMRSMARKAWQDRLDALDREIAEFDRKISETTTRLNEVKREREARAELLRLKAEGKLDPTDPAHIALMQAAGYTADDVRRDDFEDRAATDDRRAKRREEDLDDDLERFQRGRDEKRRERDRVAKEGPQSDEQFRQGTLPTEELAARGASRAGSDEIGNVISTARTEGAKLALAETVSSTEAEPVRADSQAYASNGVTEVAAVTDTGTADFDFDAPPVQTASADISATEIFPKAPAVGAAFAEASGGTATVQTAALNQDAQNQLMQTRVSTPAMTG